MNLLRKKRIPAVFERRSVDKHSAMSSETPERHLIVLNPSKGNPDFREARLESKPEGRQETSGPRQLDPEPEGDGWIPEESK